MILETDSPRHHRLAIPDHNPLRIGTLNAILRTVAEVKVWTKQTSSIRVDGTRPQTCGTGTKQQLHGEDIQMILSALRQLDETSSWAYPEGRRLIGFRAGKSR